MSGIFGELITHLQHGDYLQGKYTRRAVGENGSIRFNELIVETNGGSVYKTTDPAENEQFFSCVDYQGCGINSGYSQEQDCGEFESIGNWYSIIKINT